jgi:putative transposase
VIFIVAVARAIQLIKSRSSSWMHQAFREFGNFGWQQGYGAFSMSISQLPEAFHYIQSRADHHRITSFREEYLAFLKKHELAEIRAQIRWN